MVDGNDIPDGVSRLGVECNEPAVDGAEVQLAVVEGDAAIDGVAADDAGTGARDFGIKGPQDFAGSGIDRVGDAPQAGGVDDAVGDERRRFQAIGGAQLCAPHQAELADVLLVDLFQGAEALLVVGSSVHRPIGPVVDGNRIGLLATPDGEDQRAGQ